MQSIVQAFVVCHLYGAVASPRSRAAKQRGPTFHWETFAAAIFEVRIKRASHLPTFDSSSHDPHLTSSLLKLASSCSYCLRMSTVREFCYFYATSSPLTLQGHWRRYGEADSRA